MPSLRKRQTLQAVPQSPVRNDGTVIPNKHQKISLRAYALYEQRGCRDGFDFRDWLQAEREILTEDSIQ